MPLPAALTRTTLFALAAFLLGLAFAVLSLTAPGASAQAAGSPAMAKQKAKAAKLPAPRAGAYAHPGGALVVTVKGRPGRVAVALSTDRRLGGGDLVLTRKLKLRRVRRGRRAGRRHRAAKAAATARLTVPATAATATYRVLACLGKRCRAGGKVQVTTEPVGTRELVAKAVAAHKLSASRALVYRVWAALGNHKLPARYRGDIGAEDPSALVEAAAGRSRLKAADRRRIAPYLLPPTAWVGAGRKRSPSRTGPAAKTSALDPLYTTCGQQATAKHWSVLTGKHVRIWWWREHGANRAAAAGLVKAADKTIWPAFTKLMGRQPPADSGRPCDGGDGHYDIYLLPKSVIPKTSRFRAVTLPYPPRCSAAPSFTEFNTHGGGDPPTRFELAHELFHAFQFAFTLKNDCAQIKEHRWFDEASAVWASTWLYPHEEGRHERVPDRAIENTHCSLDHFDYDAFPFALDLQRRLGLQTIPKIYRAYGSISTTLATIDSVLPGGFAADWRNYLRDLLNEEATGSKFKDWYGIDTRAVPTPPMTSACGNDFPTQLGLHGAHAYRTGLFLEGINSVSASFYDFTFEDDVKQVTVHNHTMADGTGIGGTNISDLQAVLEMRDGSWKVDDLSDNKETTYCLSDRHIKRMVVIYGNHSIGSSDAPYLNDGRRPPAAGPVYAYQSTVMVDVRDSCGQYFKVTGVSGHLDYSADYTVGEPARCAVSGSEHKVASLDPDGQLGTTDGSYEDGGLVLNVPVFWSGGRDYSATPVGDFDCSLPPTCHAEIAEPGGPIASGSAAAGASGLEAEIINPKPNFYSGCAAAYGEGYFAGEPGTISTSVPLATLTSGRPFTLTWQHSGSSGPGRQTDRALTVKVTPVNESGGPLHDPEIVEGPLR